MGTKKISIRRECGRGEPLQPKEQYCGSGRVRRVEGVFSSNRVLVTHREMDQISNYVKDNREIGFSLLQEVVTNMKREKLHWILWRWFGMEISV